MANTFVAETLTGATFFDAATGTYVGLSGTWIAEYDPSGNLVHVLNPSFSITPASGSAITWNSFTASGAGPYLLYGASSSTTTYTKLNIDYAGMTPATLTGGSAAATSTSVYNATSKSTDFLFSTGVVASAADTGVTTSIKGAVFADGSTLSGTWTAIYDASGTLQAVENATFVVTSTSGNVTTFTSMGTLPYANTPSSTSYELHSMAQSGSSQFSYLYVDWKSENPTSFYEGSPSLYTSVVNSGSSPIRLVSDGTTGIGSTPIISGMPSGLSGVDTAAVKPFSGVTISESDNTTTTSATITLSVNGVASDANGTLSGSGLIKIATGTYSLSATTPALLTSELQALSLKPTVAEGPSGTTFKTTIALAINDSDGSVSSSTMLTETATCFLPGTMIDTPFGAVPIEALKVGDLVTAIENGHHLSRPIRWIGRGTMDVTRAADPISAFPVRIRRHAFAENVPFRDLLVTSEHCVHLDGRLIPARMLVNGGSIVSDVSIPRYAFLHLELERHSVLLAEGLEAESYLDTGNRGNFASGAQPHFAVEDGHAAWNTDAAAPLCVDRDVVEPIWSRLVARARTLGFGVLTQMALVSEPELRLVTADGRSITPSLADGDVYAFVVPAGARGLRLVSRRFRPSETVGPFLDDRRALGVRVGRIGVATDGARSVTTAHLTDAGLPGWHAVEGESEGRWTTGDATLPIPANQAMIFLDVEVVAAGPYPDRRAA